MAQNGEIIHALPNQPVHLWQYNEAADAYKNGMGCGAFSTAMALSCYDPKKYGSYDVARFFFSRMIKVPYFSGTFERENSRMARRQGYWANSYDQGTILDLTAAVDVGAPTIMLINPGRLGIGQHDVVLVGYSTDHAGNTQRVFLDNTARQETQPLVGQPGNDQIAMADLDKRWTGVFTPFFASEDQENKWLALTNRPKPGFSLVEAALG